MSEYTRKGHILTNTETGEQNVCLRKIGKKSLPAINEAKRQSRKLQVAGNTVRKV